MKKYFFKVMQYKYCAAESRLFIDRETTLPNSKLFAGVSAEEFL